VLTCAALTGCNDPVAAPVDLFHNLQGGQIAAERPPPPGAGQPYPKLGTVPPKPTAMPDPAFRRSLQAQLAAERDTTERAVSDQPIEHIPPPPPAAPTQPPTANATLAAADAPPPPPPAAASPNQPSAPADAALHIAGAPSAADLAGPAGLPEIPAAPPPPATFEGVPAEPAPTPRLMPISLLKPPAGAEILFPAGSAVLPQSQTQPLKDAIARRGKQQIVQIIGLGEASADTPDGQAAAIGLALKRAQAVAAALAAMHVPQSAMRLGADAFGRGAVVRLIP
jgi:outer membrane protein OmpA-like peptidoglycan-associated protein